MGHCSSLCPPKNLPLAWRRWPACLLRLRRDICKGSQSFTSLLLFRNRDFCGALGMHVRRVFNSSFLDKPHSSSRFLLWCSVHSPCFPALFEAEAKATIHSVRLALVEGGHAGSWLPVHSLLCRTCKSHLRS